MDKSIPPLEVVIILFPLNDIIPINGRYLLLKNAQGTWQLGGGNRCIESDSKDSSIIFFNKRYARSILKKDVDDLRRKINSSDSNRIDVAKSKFLLSFNSFTRPGFKAKTQLKCSPVNIDTDKPTEEDKDNLRKQKKINFEDGKEARIIMIVLFSLLLLFGVGWLFLKIAKKGSKVNTSNVTGNQSLFSRATVAKPV